jgi:hypothetical protein
MAKSNRQDRRWIALRKQRDEAHAMLRQVTIALEAMETAERSRNYLILTLGPGDTHSRPAPHLVADYWVEKINTFLGDKS